MNLPSSPEPEQLASCTTCHRPSHSLTSFGWCPWCDTAHKPAAPRLATVTIDGREFHLGAR